MRAALSAKSVRWRRSAGRVWVLAGMGGLGKSTVALAAAEAAVSAGWRVWWVTATDPGSVSGAMLEILRELGAPETVTRPVGERAPVAAQRAWEYLNSPHAPGRRLLIFDNVDDPSVLAVPGTESPADHRGWLRPDPRGVVIVTTRNKDPRMWGRGMSLCDLQPLDEVAAAQVLTDLAPGIHDPDGWQARELGRRLGGLPLALTLAGSYLALPLARWTSFAEYGRALDSAESPATIAELTDMSLGVRTDIQRTWGLSLDALAADGCPQARPLLILLSCYASGVPIPVRLLRPDVLDRLLCSPGQRTAGRETAGDATSGDAITTAADRQGPAACGSLENALDPRRRVQSALAGLAKTGLIDTTGTGEGWDGRAVTMHPVLADVNRAWLRQTGGPALAAIRAAAALLRVSCDELEPDSPAHWPAWRRLVPHILALTGRLADLLDNEAAADLLAVTGLAAQALIRCGATSTAVDLAGGAVKVRTGTLHDHPARLAVRCSLAAATAEQGRVQEAEVMYRELLADHERVHGTGHPLTLAVRFELARALGFIRSAEAEPLHRQVLAELKKTLGPDDPLTLEAHHWLGRLLNRSGRYEEAERTYQRVLHGRIKVLTTDHQDTLVTRHTLAWAIARQGRYEQAEQMFQHVIQDQQRLLGKNHPQALGSGRALGYCLRELGRPEEAERQYRQVLAAQRRVRGDDHPATLETEQGLARALAAQGRFSEAEEIYRRVLTARLKVHVPGHPHTLTTCQELAQVITELGKDSLADHQLRHVLAHYERAAAPNAQPPGTAEPPAPTPLATEPPLGFNPGKRKR